MILQEMFRPVSAIPKYTDEQKKAMDAAREDDDFVLPELQKPEAGFFDGIGEAAWKGPVAGALKTASAFDTMLSSTGMARSALQHYQNETGDFFDDLDKRQVEVENQLDKDARQVRAMAKKDFSVNPETMGTAAQIVYGIGETIPKAIGYSALGGQAGGALMFGADLGVNRAQELMDEGVDKETAINAGLVTFGTAAFGMRLPATFGKSRIASATIGAAVNTGLSVAELQGVNWVLQSQNYNELSKKYELNFVDLATSAIFGGVMGAAFFRPGMTPKQTAQVQIRDEISKQIKEVHPEFSDEQINAQAEIHAVGVMAMAERAGVDASEIAPTIVRGDGELNQNGFSEVSQNSKNLEVREGFERLTDDSVTEITYIPENSVPQFKKIGDLVSWLKDRFSERDRATIESTNQNVRFTKTGLSSSAKSNIVLKERGHNDVYSALESVVERAQYEGFEPADARHPNLAGQDVYISAVQIGGRLFAVRLKFDIPSDSEIAIRKEHLGETNIEDLRYKDHRLSEIELAPVLGANQNLEGDNAGLLGLPLNEAGGSTTESTKPTVSNVSLGVLRGAVKPSRIDGQTLYQRGEGEFFQTAYHGTPHVFDKFNLQAIGTGEGAQAHGWGLYFAKNREVAERYRTKVSRANILREIREEYDPSQFDDYEVFLEALNSGAFSEKTTRLLNALKNDDWLGFDQPMQAVKAAFSKDFKNYDPSPELVSEVNNFGRLFELDIPDSNVLLDEQLPLNKQSKEVREAVLRYMQDNPERYIATKSIDEFDDGKTGKQLYKEIVFDQRMKGSKTPEKDASLILNEYGIKGISYDGRVDGRSFVIFDDEAIKVLDFYQKSMNQNQVRGSFNPALNEIKLTPNADMSTFSHEMGHWYLTNLFELSGKKGVDPTLVEDVNTLLKEFGVNSVEDWNALGIEGQRKFQEQFASWVEIYLSSGKAPKPSLTRLFERMAQWIVDVYRELGGTKKAVSDRFEGEFQTKLPETSPEVQKVLDRLFAKDREIRKARKVDAEQVAAARMVQSERTNKDRLKEIIAMPDGEKKAKALLDMEKALTAQLKALRDVQSGRPVDVSKELKDVNINEQAINQGKHDFGRQVLVGDNQRAVILQNRDRATDASVNQMLKIAGSPQYGMVSVSRGYNGAPIVSFGQLPEQRFMGNQDFIVESNGSRIPFQYAVVEGDSVETSNFILGEKNPNYGNPELVSAVVGNGRMTALKEAYARNTAGQYRQELTEDRLHGVDPAVIAEMKNPILVRFISPDDVTTGLISRSNADQVLARNPVEIAFEDAPKIRANIQDYKFDEKGKPTRDTVLQFAQDIDDVNAQGALIAGGEPSQEAIQRLRNAVFYEAYQNPVLSQMYSIETGTGVARILNALSAMAPKIVRLRETAKSLDFSKELVNAVNEIIKARTESADGKVILGQGGLFEGDVIEPFIRVLSENSNSTAGILRVLSPLADWAEAASQVKEGGLFGEDVAPSATIRDLVAELQNIQNDLNVQKSLKSLHYEINQPSQNIEEPEMDLNKISRSVLDENESEAARAELQNFDNPDQVFKFIDDDGNETTGTLSELLEQGQKAVDEAEIEADSYGRVTECVLRNEGI